MRDLIFFICFLVVGFLIVFYLYVTMRDQIRKLFHRKPKTKNKRKNMLEERMKKQNLDGMELRSGRRRCFGTHPFVPEKRGHSILFCEGKRRGLTSSFFCDFSHTKNVSRKGG